MCKVKFPLIIETQTGKILKKETKERLQSKMLVARQKVGSRKTVKNLAKYTNLFTFVWLFVIV